MDEWRIADIVYAAAIRFLREDYKDNLFAKTYSCASSLINKNDN